ncbi:hypothetical protein FB451DRAFT_1433903 [Mycena latifolia]|nr:hypothetical protein FB451DRAFT_1433903 [Mycena latifolia]
MAAARHRSRSFHLNAGALALQHTEVGIGIGKPQAQRIDVSATGLLALARQAAATVAVALLGGCAPGVRPRGGACRGGWWRRTGAGAETVRVRVRVRVRRGGCRPIEGGGGQADGDEELQIMGQDTEDAPQSIEELGAVSTIKAGEEEQIQIEAHDGSDAEDAETQGADLPVVSVPPQIQACENDGGAPLAVGAAPEEPDPQPSPPSASSSIVPDLTETTALDLPTEASASLVPEPPAACPPPHAQLRADLVRKITAFTAARVSRAALAPAHPPAAQSLPASPPPRRPVPAPADDPFADSPHPTFPRPLPARAAAHALAQRLLAAQQQSPTPHSRAGRPPLRQQTVFFNTSINAGQVESPASKPRAPPTFWAPARPCKVAIKAPPPPSASKARAARDKENRVVVTV